MSGIFVFQSLMECIAVGFVIWGLFNEQKLVALEEKIFANIRRKKLKLNNTASYTDLRVF